MKRTKLTVPSHVDLVLQADRERPALSWRERQAIRRLMLAGRFERAERSGFDPLELRLGLQADLRQRRPYYAIWNPAYHEILRCNPALDDSIPGASWLSTVYRGNRRDAVTLPSVRSMLNARAKAFADQYLSPPPATSQKAPSPQADLFAEGDA